MQDFFRNFSTIVLLAVVGTVISTLVYGLATYCLFTFGVVKHLNPDSPLVESLIFGSLISAIDPVATLSIFQGVISGDCVVVFLKHRLLISGILTPQMCTLQLYCTIWCLERAL